MRIVALSLLLVLAGCGTDPARFGITGAVAPTSRPPLAAPMEGVTGAQAPGSQLSPSVGPNTGAGRFWGYN